MKVVVLGAGLAGVPTAYHLLKDGHDVTVIDRQPSAALETSFANGSLLCLGHSYPWASPAAPKILIKSLIRRDQALRISPRLDPRMWSWLLKFLAECPRHRADKHAATRLRLATYSLQVLKDVTADTKFDYHHTDKGLLYVYRTSHAMDEGVRQMNVLKKNGLDVRVVSPKEVAALEPALAHVRDALVGAVYIPADGTGDARIFTQELSRVCAERGAEFMYETTIEGLSLDGKRVSGVQTSQGTVAADAVVVAMGSFSPLLLRRYGIKKLDVFPVKGYSLTVPIERPAEAPVVGGLDEDNLLAFSVLGDRLRLTATAEFVGYDRRHQASDFRYMTKAARDLFPTIGDYSKAAQWAGLRPATPDGNPVFGATEAPNLFINCGHGSMGWTMSCGSGKITADLIAGRNADIDLTDMLYQA
jgi:D-amino-acid dehydrogenase